MTIASSWLRLGVLLAVGDFLQTNTQARAGRQAGPGTARTKASGTKAVHAVAKMGQRD